MKVSSAVFTIALIWYAFTAYFSSGYFHPDEQYQIIEFANAVDDTNGSHGLAWEYAAQIRPALQPVFCHFTFRACDILSISSPYTKTFVLRLITGLLSVLVLFHFTNSCRVIVSKKNWVLFLILSYLLWFLPFINVRFSSETWSGMALLFSLSLIIRGNERYLTSIIIGCFFGLAFLCRYQIALAILGLVVWLILIKRKSASHIVSMALSACVILGLGVLLDAFFYQEWTFTAWNYLKINLFEGKASEFGTSPWFHYFYYVFRYSFAPIGIIILLSLMVVLVKDRKNVFLWTILPFLFVHTLIPHKEVRFLFPIANLVPILLITALQVFPKVKWSGMPSKMAKGAVALLFLLNLLCVANASFKPAGHGRMKITQEISKLNTQKHLNVFFLKNINPFAPFGLRARFYTESNLVFTPIDLETQNAIQREQKETVNVLVVCLKDLKTERIKSIIEEMDMKEVSKSVPDFMLPMLKAYGYRTKDILVLFSDTTRQM